MELKTKQQIGDIIRAARWRSRLTCLLTTSSHNKKTAGKLQTGGLFVVKGGDNPMNALFPSGTVNSITSPLPHIGLY